MNPGYNNALYLLPFDHRHSYVDGLFGFKPPSTFWDAVARYRARTLTGNEAASRIARRLRDWVDIFEHVRDANAGRTEPPTRVTQTALNVNG